MKVVNENKNPICVILAAGAGLRLQEGGFREAKPLVSVLGISLAERVVMQIQSAGIHRFVVVLGHEHEQVRSHFEEIRERRSCKVDYVVADVWQHGNGCSAAAASCLINESRFLLAMVDHLLSAVLINRVLASPPRLGEIALAVDRRKEDIFDLDDLTKVKLDGEWITAIGKELKVWDAGDTGLFYCTEAMFQGLERAQALGRYSLSDGVRECIQEGGVRAVDVNGLAWLDVDTRQAHQEAVRQIRTGLLDEIELKGLPDNGPGGQH